MSFVPLQSASRDLSVWFGSRPDLFVVERSGRKTAFWAASTVVAFIVGALVWLYPDATVELLGGRVKSGMAIIGAFALPPVVAVVSIVLLVRRSERWRIRGGGVLTNPIILGVASTFPAHSVITAMKTGRSRPQSLVEALTAAWIHAGDDRLITVWASAADRVAYAAVLRVDGDSVWIDDEPVHIGEDQYVDLAPLDAAARRAYAQATDR
jgi:hypothetical protein